ncbi:MAG TPA: 4Fe-4S binding protein [bacterium]
MSLTASTAESAPAAAAGAKGAGRVWKSPFFPAVLQALALGVLGGMIAAGWGRHGVPGGGTVPLLYTNLATLGFWVLWLMALVLLLPAIGRLWCTVCPVGWCNDLAARAGAGIAYPRRLQNLGIMALLLLGFNMAAEIFGLNRWPDRTAWMLGLVLVAAAGAGAVFRGRVFCRFWCPVGGMVSLGSRLAPVEVASKDQEVCRRCESKACFYGSTRWYRLAWPGRRSVFAHKRPGCPAYIFPPEAAPGPSCLMCTQCLKNCPYDNLRWGGRAWGSGLWREAARDRSEALLIVVLAGLVFYRLARFWAGLREVVEWPAAAVASAIAGAPPAVLKGVLLFTGFLLWPLAFFLALGMIAKLVSEVSVTPLAGPEEAAAAAVYGAAEIDEEARRREGGWSARRHTVWGYIAAYGYAFIPLIMGAYGAFALVKLNEKAAYLPLALRDPAGVQTSVAINQLLVLAAPDSLAPLTAVRWGAVALAAAGLCASLWSAGRIGARSYGAGTPAARRGAAVFRAGALLLGAVLIACIKEWLFRGPRG